MYDLCLASDRRCDGSNIRSESKHALFQLDSENCVLSGKAWIKNKLLKLLAFSLHSVEKKCDLLNQETSDICVSNATDVYISFQFNKSDSLHSLSLIKRLNTIHLVQYKQYFFLWFKTINLFVQKKIFISSNDHYLKFFFIKK